MPIEKNNLSRGRVDFSDSLTDEEVESLASDPSLEILQTSSRVEPETSGLLDLEDMKGLTEVRPLEKTPALRGIGQSLRSEDGSRALRGPAEEQDAQKAIGGFRQHEKERNSERHGISSMHKGMSLQRVRF